MASSKKKYYFEDTENEEQSASSYTEDEEIVNCICHAALEKMTLKDASNLSYDGKGPIVCDGCNKRFGNRFVKRPHIKVYHCTEREDIHQDGYDLCMNCARNRL